MKSLLYIPLIVILMTTSSSGYSTAISFAQDTFIQETSKQISIFEFLTKSEGNHITLTTDITALTQNRKTDDYQAATIATGSGQTWKIEIKARGKYRRKNSVLPPFKIKFSAKELAESGFDTPNEVKVITAFYDTEEGDNYIKREYLAYRMYELLSPLSVRARLVQIHFEDTHVSSLQLDMYCLLIEHDEELTARLNMTEAESFGLHPDSVEIEQSALTSAFNYMIGNTDWEISGMRNIKMLKATPTSKVTIIPFDFDFSGLVNAAYARPSSLTGLQNTRQRFLMADGIPYEALKSAFDKLEAAKPEMYKLCKSKILSRNNQNDLKAYLDSFYLGLKDKLPMPGILAHPSID